MAADKPLHPALRRKGAGIAADGEFYMPTMAELIRAEDLDLLGEKAVQNTSTPSNPRAADAAAYRDMFARELTLG